MAPSFNAYRAALATAVQQVVTRAQAPAPRLAQHWESVERLTWLGGAADHHQVHLSWSFGRLKGVPVVDGERPTVGVFALTRATFQDVDEAGLRASLEALVPERADGPTRVFLQRVAAQLALADALHALHDATGVEVSLFARPDAVQQAALTPRWPEHARARVAAALEVMDPVLRHRCEALWAAPSDVLLDAARLQ